MPTRAEPSLLELCRVQPNLGDSQFVYLAFDDTEDAAYIGIHEIHNAIVDEIDRRKTLRDYAFNRISQLRRQLETSTDKVQQTTLMAEITTLELFLRRE